MCLWEGELTSSGPISEMDLTQALASKGKWEEFFYIPAYLGLCLAQGWGSKCQLLKNYWNYWAELEMLRAPAPAADSESSSWPIASCGHPKWVPGACGFSPAAQEWVAFISKIYMLTTPSFLTKFTSRLTMVILLLFSHNGHPVPSEQTGRFTRPLSERIICLSGCWQ